MKASQLLRRLAVMLTLLLVAAGAFAQTATEFKPTVGQPGKDVVWVPTPQALVDKMLDLAKVTPQDYVIDLGSGDGRTVITAAKRGARALGIEYNPDMVSLSERNAKEAGVAGKASFRRADLFQSDFSDATVVTMFLLPDINLRLRPKILDMQPGTRVVSNTFTMDDWQPDETATVEEDCLSWCRALFWIVPAKVEGTWKTPTGELAITQKYQMVTGTLTSGGASTPIEGKLRGDQITFSAGGVQYSGRVNGNAIEGTMSGKSNGSFRATRS